MRTKNKQMANRDLLKEAIADAKAVKETAIANAKAALEEAFTPMLREKLAAKIAEMDELEETSLEYTKMSGQDYANFCKENPNDPGCLSEADEKEKKEVKENEEMDEAEDMDEAEKMDEVDLDELLRELESMDEDEMYEAETMDEAKEKDKELYRNELNKLNALYTTFSMMIEKEKADYLNVFTMDSCREMAISEIQGLFKKINEITKRCGDCNQKTNITTTSSGCNGC